MVVDLSPKARVSWKDKLLRGKADRPSLNFGHGDHRCREAVGTKHELWGTVDFNPLKLFPSMVLAWIHFLGTTSFLYKRQVLEEIGSLIGKVAQLDIKTGSGIRGQFARMVIFVDLEKSLVSQILVNRKIRTPLVARSKPLFRSSRSLLWWRWANPLAHG
ncbi:hypothetical protein J1N35_013593 [Gossypium stocksii]|uniref:DUF4283 domain-containing protein n=1 Tax=Gossypium stocksii TaxID=47602 RepID=A0A9D3VSZ7_9ROSI|nr:hypothetical protein J1N35_013593 [Gossypium stocksii]